VRSIVFIGLSDPVAADGRLEPREDSPPPYQPHGSKGQRRQQCTDTEQTPGARYMARSLTAHTHLRPAAARDVADATKARNNCVSDDPGSLYPPVTPAPRGLCRGLDEAAGTPSSNAVSPHARIRPCRATRRSAPTAIGRAPDRPHLSCADVKVTVMRKRLHLGGPIGPAPASRFGWHHPMS
jgi:hypothetical protein